MSSTSPFWLGFDLGGSTVRAALFDGALVEQARAREPLVRPQGDYAAAVTPKLVGTTLASLTEQLLAAVGIEAEQVAGVGIAIAAQLSNDQQLIHNAPNLGWRGQPLADMLPNSPPFTRSSDTLHICNDLTALLRAEHDRGAVAGCEDVLAVYVGSGIGGAVLSDGQLLTGATGNAGEIGHCKVATQGRPCGCGETGCLEAYAGGLALQAQVADLADQSSWRAGVISDRGVDLALVDQLAATEPVLDAFWQQTADRIAGVLANACTLLNPEVLLLGGGVLTHCPTLRQRVETRTLPLVLNVCREQLRICAPTLGESAGALGAVLGLTQRGR